MVADDWMDGGVFDWRRCLGRIILHPSSFNDHRCRRPLMFSIFQFFRFSFYLFSDSVFHSRRFIKAKEGR
jgi:hypothetical protein